MSDLEQDFDAILDEPQEAPTKVEIVEEPEEPTEEPTEEPEEETKEEPKEEPDKEQTTGSEKEPWTLTAVMDERQKRQEWEKKAKEFEEKLKSYENPEKDVSIFEDEKAWKEQQEAKLTQVVSNTALNMSQAFAEEVFGAEKVAAAAEWMKNDGVKSPYLIERFNKAKLPYHEAVKMFEEEQARQNPDDYKARLKEEIRKEVLEELQSEKPSKPAKSVTPSLASERSAGKETSLTQEDFEDILGA